MNAEELIDDRYCIVVSTRSPLARRAGIQLADLVNERWIVPPSDIPEGASVSTPIQEAFLNAGLQPPEFMITTFSAFLRTTMVASGQYVSVLPQSVLHLHPDKLRELRTALPMPRWPVAIVSLKSRTLNPAAGLSLNVPGRSRIRLPVDRERTSQHTGINDDFRSRQNRGPGA